MLFIAAAVVFAWKGESFLSHTDDCAFDKPDVVVVLAGSHVEDPGRVKEGTAVFQEKGADYLIFPLRHPTIKWSWLIREYGVRIRIPQEKVLIGRAGAKGRKINQELGGTFAEAEMTIRIMAERNIKSALVVTSGYHVRRAGLAFERALKGRDLRFCFHEVKRSAGIDPWWLDKDYLFRVLGEYKKLIGSYFLYR